MKTQVVKDAPKKPALNPWDIGVILKELNHQLRSYSSALKAATPQRQAHH